MAFTVVAYDIEDDGRREKISRILEEAGGLRVQKSVFEVELSPSEFRRLRKRLASLCGEDDSIRYYPLCRTCRGRILCQGKDIPGRRSVEVF